MPRIKTFHDWGSDRSTECLHIPDPHLESLYISGHDIATLKHIGGLDTLTSLELSALLQGLSSSAIHSPLFANLHRVELDSVVVEETTHFFKMCVDASLRSVMVEFNSHPRTSVALAQRNQSCD